MRNEETEKQRQTDRDRDTERVELIVRQTDI